jgi:Fe2+ or Zn2+ uptake regulation protein
MRTTKARTLIIDIISHASNPIDAAAIWAAVQKLDQTVNRATVFRTLTTLVTHGEVVKVDFGDGKARYESVGHHHHHLICTQCNSIDSVDVCKAEELVATAAQKKHFKVTSHQLEYFGLCSACQK